MPDTERAEIKDAVDEAMWMLLKVSILLEFGSMEAYQQYVNEVYSDAVNFDPNRICAEVAAIEKRNLNWKQVKKLR